MDCGSRPNKHTLYVTAAVPWQLCTVLHLAVQIERRAIGWCYVVNATLIFCFCQSILLFFVWTFHPHPKWPHSGEILNSYWIEAVSHRNTPQCWSMAMSKPETCLTSFFLENMDPWHLKPQSSGPSTRPQTPNSPWVWAVHFWLAYSNNLLMSDAFVWKPRFHK